MYTRSFARARARCTHSLRQLRFTVPLVALCACSPLATNAATLVLFDFEDANDAFELTPDFLAAGVAAGAWSDIDGTLTGSLGDPGRALSSKSWADGNALRFTLLPQPGQALMLDGFSFDEQASGTGPKGWQLRIDGVPVAIGDTASAFATHAGVFSAEPLTGAIEISLLGLDASANAGTWRIDNFALTGAVAPVPTPGGLVLLLSGIAGLVGLRIGAPA
ncbi:MAG: hypothetical protein IT494_02685 [Gammaproteobacteria bacterium]|nr:hypothetical protein [Gammaproteobacteria bacterium]